MNDYEAGHIGLRVMCALIASGEYFLYATGDPTPKVNVRAVTEESARVVAGIIKITSAEK